MRQPRTYFADTSFLIDLAKNNESAEKLFEAADRLVSSSLCIYELGRKLEFDWSRIGGRKIVDFDGESAVNAYRIYRQLEQRGELVNTMDILIAGQVQKHEKPLVTAESDFKKIEEVDAVYYRD